MFRNIVMKELMDTVRSQRFIIGWVVMIVLMVMAVFLLSEDVQQRVERMELIERSQEEYVSNYAHTNRIGYVLAPSRPPEQSEVLFRGLENADEEDSFFSNPLKKLFPRIDLIFIISVLLSLLAVIFTYDSVCGEREEGTLKLLHSTTVSRASVIVGKLVGTWLALAVPFLAVYLFAILLSSMTSGLILDADMAVELGSVALASLIYLAFFLALGLLISSLVKHSGTSILLSLFLWVLFVLALPNASPVIASQLQPLPSVNEVEREVYELQDTIRDNRLREEFAREAETLREKYSIPDSIPLQDWVRPAAMSPLGWSEERYNEFQQEFTELFRSVGNRVNEEQSAKANALWDELERKIESQSDLARTISLLSPTPAFTYLSTDVASLGLRAEEYFSDEIRAFYAVFREYMDARQRDLEEELGHRIGSEDFIDISNRPRFQYASEPIADRLAAALPYFGHLVISLLIALALAVVAYIRYDVR